MYREFKGTFSQKILEILLFVIDLVQTTVRYANTCLNFFEIGHQKAKKKIFLRGDP
jgi:hypothetical protein